uniref:Uncharacterized protein n=1 Tax=Proboscia inermis TaxID=420281 RepID=A0A7S0CDU8_9STRA|mmetsp:Transcript_40587/g.41267  ORF Transcript_40587/g.41267 Transcript_40587/m.41267 type:complete len:167 (+) Transcript_40587:272-772(+)|eukprot:CAMPEP_0171293140 /NCGR_PEP_ID=MMETSP0816-20121228/1273_1 /TAXON_ID=420281 /ORGANISM="Proboscia inermis, Strain CCAP1064/1" /LENGTH=166 /DNA_ID=CAMNT_0011763653 /DNA_START=208 /DNA_END=708 /DNA_ORIENTATION=-
MFLRVALFLLLTGIVSVTAQCFYEGDGCSRCSVSDDALEWHWVCPDFCGPGRTFTFTQLVSYADFNSFQTPVFTTFSEVSGCIDNDNFLAFLDSKGAYIYNFSREQQPLPGTWSCQEVCSAAVDNKKGDNVLTSPMPISDDPPISAALVNTSTLGILVMVFLALVF